MLKNTRPFPQEETNIFCLIQHLSVTFLFLFLGTQIKERIVDVCVKAGEDRRKPQRETKSLWGAKYKNKQTKKRDKIPLIAAILLVLVLIPPIFYVKVVCISKYMYVIL